MFVCLPACVAGRRGLPSGGGNADAFDYETTVVQIKKGKSEIKALIQKDIAAQAPSPKFETLADSEAADVVIIVGTDFK